jgi:REP element-mobilizing transposase RayT
MPDHLHALVEGMQADSDFLRFVAMFKQRAAFRHTRQRSAALWQEGFFEHVLRDEDDLESVAAYIIENPIRAGLCRDVSEYPHLGSGRYSLEQLASAVQIVPNWKSRRP